MGVYNYTVVSLIVAEFCVISYHDTGMKHYVMHSLSNISCMDQIMVRIFVLAVANLQSFCK